MRRLLQSLFSGSRVCLDARVALTPPVSVTRDILEGAVSSPELSKAAQPVDQALTTAGYVDDIEHYGNTEVGQFTSRPF